MKATLYRYYDANENLLYVSVPPLHKQTWTQRFMEWLTRPKMSTEWFSKIHSVHMERYDTYEEALAEMARTVQYDNPSEQKHALSRINWH